jgi:hypothetical protein
MSQKLHSAAVAAIDELHLIVRLQQLHKISLEQLERAKWTRTGLLITCYLYQVKPCLEKIEAEHRVILQLTSSQNNPLEVRNDE